MMSRGKVKSDVEGLTKRLEEMSNKLQTSIRGEVGGNSMLGEHMEEEDFASSGDVIML